MDLSIKTWGGSGDLALFAEIEEIDWEDFDDGPGGSQFGGTEFESNSGEANEEINIFLVTGRIDITIYPYADIDEITIVATWEDMDLPGPGPGPDPGPDPPIGEEILSCNEYSDFIFRDISISIQIHVLKNVVRVFIAS